MRWSKLKSSLDVLRAPAVRDRVALHQARYRYAREEVGRVWVTVDGRQVASFDTSSEYNDYQAIIDLEAYLSLAIDDALTSPSPLVRALAVLDRRLGKRRLRALKVGPLEHPLVRRLYRLRCQAEAIDVAADIMPPPQDLFAGSEAFERFMGRWSRRLAPLLVRFAAVGERDSVLDVGSGTGALAFALVEAIPSAHVTGVDPSSAYVRYAHARTPGDRARFVVGDAQALAMTDAAFDKTLSLLVMNFIPDPAKALREMMRVTRPGGVVAAAVWDYDEGMQMLRVFWDEAAALDSTIAARDERHMRLCKRGELAALWRATGLEEVDDQPITIELSFASFDDYWRPFLGGQGPAGAYVASLSNSDRSALEARLRRRLLGAQPDAPFTLQARAWAVKGIVPVSR